MDTLHRSASNLEGEGVADATHRRFPQVSVVVPNYNHARFLRQRIESVLNQTFRDFELIILDDASTDGSSGVIGEFLSDTRVVYHPNRSNSGSPFVQWNRGVQLAKAPIVWIAESDDYADPNFLNTLLPVLLSDPKIGLAYCQSWRVDGGGTVSGSLDEAAPAKHAERWKTAFVHNGHDECRNQLFWRNTIPNASAVLFRKDVYLNAGCAPTDMRLSGDWMMWVRMLLISDVAFVPATLNYFRHHDASVRENTRYHMSLEEKWAIQRLIAQSCSSSLRRAMLTSRIASEAFAEHAYALRERGNPACLSAMSMSLLRWPFGEITRHKVWLHMLLVKLGLLDNH